MTGKYKFALFAEDENDSLLLEMLVGKAHSPFSQDEGYVEVFAYEPIVDPGWPEITIHKISSAGKRKIAAAQKARWRKFKKLGKTPLAKKKKLVAKPRKKKIRSFWDTLSPEARSAEMSRRRQVAVTNKAERERIAAELRAHIPPVQEAVHSETDNKSTA
jgi:hypothetical protein